MRRKRAGLFVGDWTHPTDAASGESDATSTRSSTACARNTATFSWAACRHERARLDGDARSPARRPDGSLFLRLGSAAAELVQEARAGLRGTARRGLRTQALGRLVDG